eukprot:TRINITY_DN1605_c0_g1_i1.p1 TRINITY_DN1605_c0_g1~~TRINITY_DN1605_c0_g1_i1.p1  ORF type:complete len:427 (+),score=87.60 TRINITY_DN1605_c0_g1_i1:100-1380(+)
MDTTKDTHTNMELPNGLMCGTGEYTTGFVHGQSSASDKKLGVIALVLFDLRSRKMVGNLKMVGTNGKKFDGIRRHFAEKIEAVYKGMEVNFESFPEDSVENEPKAFLKALDTMKKGDFVTIFTPDDTHFEIAKEAIERGLHVLITKPSVKTLAEHHQLIELAKKHNVLVQVEFHKRFDPVYSDARERIRKFGDFSYFNSYMSQPKFQLDTFKAWAGRSSDISYYLNSHHIDIHCWAMQGIAVPTRVVAMASSGIATSQYGCVPGTEDTITLLVHWANLGSGNLGCAVYTASWSTPKADVHSQQRFHYMGHSGEISVDQAHRGYSQAVDSVGFSNLNPLYMKYTPDSRGRFSGQLGYGYRSIEEFVKAVQRVNAGASPAESDVDLPTLNTTLTGTAILEAGRLSLDHGNRGVRVVCSGEIPMELVLE